MAFLDPHGPVAIAHRGGALDAPENTLEAFANAIELGYRYLETDVHVSEDGVPVAFHDDRLDRTTDMRGAIADLTIEQIERADAGGGARIPRLATLLTRWPHARINLDPKHDAAVGPMAALIGEHGAWDRVCVGSFSDARIARVRELSGHAACTSMGPRAVAIARIASLTGRIPRQGAQCIQVPLRHGRVPIVTPRFVSAAHRSGLYVHVWTINDTATMHRLLDMGVDGVMTDRPRTLKDVFEARGLKL
jgi:glycerophosphoryl diester phosphodiesterase